MTTQTQILTTFMDRIWNTGDFSELALMVSRNYKVGIDSNDPWSGQTIDHETFKTRVMYSRNAFTDLFFDIKETIAQPDKIAIRWSMSGIHEGDLPQLSASNKKFTVSGMTFYYFENNKISGHSQSFDQLGFLAQIGALNLS